MNGPIYDGWTAPPKKICTRCGKPNTSQTYSLCDDCRDVKAIYADACVVAAEMDADLPMICAMMDEAESSLLTDIGDAKACAKFGCSL